MLLLTPKSVKKSKMTNPNHGLKYPKFVLTQKGQHLLLSEAFGTIWMHYNIKERKWLKLLKEI